MADHYDRICKLNSYKNELAIYKYKIILVVTYISSVEINKTYYFDEWLIF